MSRVHYLGMSRDMKERDVLARVDNRVRQNKIQGARSHIYGSALGVTSTAVENLLKDQSLVPASVSFVFSLPPKRDHSVKNAFSDRLACWASGRRYSSIFCEFSVLLKWEIP